MRETKKNKMQEKDSKDRSTEEVATFGAGCFWCVEAVFAGLKGVRSVVSGYMGGKRENPTYEQVCSGATGHAEVVQVTFDPQKVSFADLLEVFWATHNPTTPNQQGADKGTQYRSVVFYHSVEQKQQAEQYKRQLDESGVFPAPIITEISEAEKFYPAENYHQRYFELQPEAAYCQYVISPKIEKFKKSFAGMLQ